jgi:hypothetical protein
MKIKFTILCLLLSASPLIAQVPSQPTMRDKGLTVEKVDTRPMVETRGPAPSQPVCDGANYATDDYLNNVSMGGPIVGIEWFPAANETLTRIEMFTGETTGPIAFAIYSDNPGPPSKPGVDLGDTGYFPLSTTNSWQGKDLLTPVTVTAGTKYWVVLDPTGGEQSPVQNGVGQTYWGSDSGTITSVPAASWFGPFSFPDRAWKFRMFCAVPASKDVYAVKFLCGSLLPKLSPSARPDNTEWPVKPGNYLTAINVHNPNGSLINFRKKAVLIYRADKPPGPEEPRPPGKLLEASLRDDWGLEIDCADIRNKLLSDMAPPAPWFIKGWVIIEVPTAQGQKEPNPLDVTAVYTSHGWDTSTNKPVYAGFAEDVEPVLPKRIKQ